jgi:hypothetical protein
MWSQILMTLKFLLRDFRKFLEYKISWKSIQWKPSWSMRTDGQTDMTKVPVIVNFRNFANAPKNDVNDYQHLLLRK